MKSNTHLNLLFVCGRNQWRSPTAEKIFRNDRVRTRSAGVSASAKTKLNGQMIKWADMIFVMEKEHKVRMMSEFSTELQGRQIIVLDIPDEYSFMDPELVEFLQSAVSPYLELPSSDPAGAGNY